MRRLVQQSSRRNPLPEGTLAVGTGLAVAGLAAYGFLIISARALGPERYASLSALWAFAFLVGPGFFFPIEQEVARATGARRAQQLGAGPLIRRAAAAAALLVALVVAGSLIAGPVILRRLFDGQELLLAALVISFSGYGTQHLVRGALSGNGRFRRYGLLVGTEGIVRVVVSAALALFGVATAGPYGLAFAVAPWAAVAIGARGSRDLMKPGPEAPWAELSSALGFLLAGAIFAQLLVNAGPLLVKLLASDSEKAAAGRFLAGLIITRVPLFLFQAVQAALLPKLSGFAAAGRHADFRSGLTRLLIVVVALAAAAIIGAIAIGPWLVRFLFGGGFDLGRRDLGFLAGGSAAYMVALVLAQALIALSGHARAAAGWLVGVTTLALVTAASKGLLNRVETGFLAGAVAALVAMAILLVPRIRAAEALSRERLMEAARELPVEP